MKVLVLAAAILGVAVSAVSAQQDAAVPDLKGTWTGKGKAIVLGANAHHPGKQGKAAQPRVRDVSATHIVEGQDGRVAWGRSSTTVADQKEQFVWALTNDNRSIIGADLDGYFHITLITPDRMEKCYVHNGTSPSRSMVATCYLMDRVKK
ncbi:MAG: hypothetical protein K2Y71_19835 [Xanthobacteraceae bacterium]|nr:hypothetical protein [Xanthobacteraceae bacterium]